MKTFKYLYENLKPSVYLNSLARPDDILFFDIETTGLSRKKDNIFLIGTGYYSDNGLNIIQWFAENESEEINVLKALLEFADSFTCLLNYNGNSFDIPFTLERMNKYGISMPPLNSIDIYTFVKPLKKILSLHDLTLKSVERFLNIKRDDEYSGGELISVYKSYTKKKSEKELNLLLLHNKEDVLNLHYVTSIIEYNSLNGAKLQYDNCLINEYYDYSNVRKKELLLSGLHNSTTLPRSFNTFKSNEIGSFIMNYKTDSSLSIRVPILQKTLNYYFENYRDYYYLPNEKMCILKSMAGGVKKENRENATKENCKISLNDSFIPMPLNAVIKDIRIFKDSYKSKQHYIRLEDFLHLDKDNRSLFLKLYYDFFFV